MQAPGDVGGRVSGLAELAPEEIRDDMEQLARLAQEQPQFGRMEPRDWAAALPVDTPDGVTAQEAMERVDAYARGACGGEVFGVNTAPTPSNGSEAVKAEIRNAAIAEEMFYTGHGTYTTSIAELEQEGFSPHPDVVTVIESADHDGYCITASHRETGESFYLSSERGEVTPGSCT